MSWRVSLLVHAPASRSIVCIRPTLVCPNSQTSGPRRASCSSSLQQKTRFYLGRIRHPSRCSRSIWRCFRPHTNQPTIPATGRRTHREAFHWRFPDRPLWWRRQVLYLGRDHRISHRPTGTGNCLQMAMFHFHTPARSSPRTKRRPRQPESRALHRFS